MVYNNLIGNSIYIPQYSGRKELKNLKGKFKTIKKFKFNILYKGNLINDKLEGNKKYIYDDEIYNIRPYKNGLKIGKGYIYNKKKIINFENNFINDKYEGN